MTFKLKIRRETITFDKVSDDKKIIYAEYKGRTLNIHCNEIDRIRYDTNWTFAKLSRRQQKRVREYFDGLLH